MSRVSDLLRGSVVPGHLPQHSHHCHRLLITVHHGDDIWYDRALTRAVWRGQDDKEGQDQSLVTKWRLRQNCMVCDNNPYPCEQSAVLCKLNNMVVVFAPSVRNTKCFSSLYTLTDIALNYKTPWSARIIPTVAVMFLQSRNKPSEIKGIQVWLYQGCSWYVLYFLTRPHHVKL